jgi:hypothetical protein
MTAYTTISDSEVSPESCLKESLYQRLANNPIAMTEGAAGAPKVLSGGLQTGASAAVTTATMRDGCFTTAKISNATLAVNKLDASGQQKLVPNGDAHNHASYLGAGGGDPLGNAAFAADAFRGAKVYPNLMQDRNGNVINGRWTLPPNTAYTPAQGFYNIVMDWNTVSDNVVLIMIFPGQPFSSINAWTNGLFWFDGLYTYVYNNNFTGPTRYVYYQKWDY